MQISKDCVQADTSVYMWKLQSYFRLLMTQAKLCVVWVLQRSILLTIVSLWPSMVDGPCAKSILMDVPVWYRDKNIMFSDRSFTAASSRAWNDLLVVLCSYHTAPSPKHWKTHLFSSLYISRGEFVTIWYQCIGYRWTYLLTYLSTARQIYIYFQIYGFDNDDIALHRVPKNMWQHFLQ